MQAILRDVRFALRTFARVPSFSVVIVVTLALGIGPATAIFSVLDALLLRPLPYRDAETIAAVSRARQGGEKAPVSCPDFADFRTMTATFSDLAAASATGSFNIGEIAEPIRAEGSRVTPSFFQLLGTPAMLGRIPSGAPVRGERIAILSHALWQSAFGGRADVIGRDARLNGEPHRIVAVMPRDFAYPPRAELWVPFDLTGDALGHRAFHQYRVVGRLKPGVSIASADADVKRVALRLGELYPDTTRGIGAAAVTLRESISGDVRRPLLVLFGAVVFLLLIACSNAANLMLTRAVAREHELAVREALGATDAGIARQLLVDAVLLTAAGGLLAIGIAALGLRLVRTLAATLLPRPELITIDGRVLAFNFGVAVAAALLFGLAPLLSREDRFAQLHSGTRAAAQRGWNTRRVREAIVVAVVALSFFLLIGAGLLLGSFSRIRGIPLGIEPDELVTMRIFLPEANYPELADRTRILEQVLEEVRGVPGIDDAAIVNGLPLENTMSGDIAFPDEGPFVAARRIASFTEISPGYFRTAGVPLLAGRDFTRDDVKNVLPLIEALAANPAGPLPPIVINDTMALRFWPGRSALGEAVIVGGGNAYRIVGVAGDVKQSSATDPTPPHVYLPLGAPLPPRPAIFMIRSSMSPAVVEQSVRSVLRRVDPDIPPYRVRTMDEVITAAIASPRLQTVLLVLFAGVALALATVGIYGVVSYNVAQRTRELGIRMAIGATSAAIVRLVVGRVTRLALLGISIGLAGAILLSESIEKLLFDFDAADPRVFTAVAVLLLLTALLASAAPALRAATVDPVVSLRQE
jgi:putative ABC transport system permease protein